MSITLNKALVKLEPFFCNNQPENQALCENLILRALNQYFIHESQALMTRQAGDNRLVVPDKHWGFHKVRGHDTRFTGWSSVRYWVNDQSPYQAQYDEKVLNAFGAVKYSLSEAVMKQEGGVFDFASQLGREAYVRMQGRFTGVSPQLALAWIICDYSPQNRVGAFVRSEILGGQVPKARIKLNDLLKLVKKKVDKYDYV